MSKLHYLDLHARERHGNFAVWPVKFGSVILVAEVAGYCNLTQVLIVGSGDFESPFTIGRHPLRSTSMPNLNHIWVSHGEVREAEQRRIEMISRGDRMENLCKHSGLERG